MDKEEVSELVKSNAQLKTKAFGVKDSIGTLIDGKLFSEKVTKENEDGSTSENYDYDKIYSALKSFVDGYNELIDNGAESNNNTVLRNTLNLTKMTAANSQLLSDVGISIGESNKLSISESTVKEANINDLKALFQGNGSYAGSVDAYATNIANAVNAENNKLSTYSANGAYVNSTVGSIYDGTY